ncbi:MAG: GNAT family N-acetyltransferase [Rhodospirillaceae bacterium]
MAVEEIRSINEVHEFDQLFDIYANSIPPEEQKSRLEVGRLLARPDYKIFIEKLDGIVRGFSIFYLSTNYDIALLEYMATDKSSRNQGIGAKLFLYGLASASGRSILIEVDSDRENTPDRTIRIRRKNFYRRLGAHQIVGLDYKLPLPGKGEPPVMDLMLHPNGRDEPFTKHDVRYWLQDIYVNVYNQSRADPRIIRMLDNLPNEIYLK